MNPRVIEIFRHLAREDNPDVAQRDAARADVNRLSGTPEYPPPVAMLAGVMKAAAGFVASGFRLADEAERARRLEVCRACEFYAADAARCTKCGCYTAAKATPASGECPVGKWDLTGAGRP